jgi:hypothetical protein
MNIVPGKEPGIMAVKTKFFRGGIKQLRVHGVVHGMAGFALASLYRLVHRGFLGGFRKIVVTRQTNIRHWLPHLHRWHFAMGEMANLAVLLFDRLMDNPGLEVFCHLRVALGTSPSFLELSLLRGRPATCDKGKSCQADETKFQNRQDRSRIHHEPPSSF